MIDKVTVKIINKSNNDLPQYSTPSAAGMDLRANLSEAVTLSPLERKLIPTGIFIELPEGYEAHVVPRSSTFKNYGLLQANSMGVVDYTYRGDNDQWHVPMYATRDVHIDKNTRISQFRIMKNQPPLVFTRVEHLTGPDRGGFGSTGK